MFIAEKKKYHAPKGIIMDMEKDMAFLNELVIDILQYLLLFEDILLYTETRGLCKTICE